MMFEAARLIALIVLATGSAGFEGPFIDGSTRDDIVDKTVVSDKMRLLFVMGLEGAGHHYIMKAHDELLEVHPNLAQVEAQFPSFRNYYLPTTMAQSSTVFDARMQDARDEMRELAKLSESLPSATIHLLRGGTSFPCAGGAQKVMQYVDPRLMAEAAEAEQVDFRVLYLKRSAKELLFADTVHRGFLNYLSDPGASQERKFMEYTRVLFTDIAVVHSFLGELDPAFVVCHDWDQLGERDQARTIADFVAPDGETAAMIEESFVGSVHLSHHGSDETLPFDVDGSVSNRLQRKLDAFENKYCGRKD